MYQRCLWCDVMRRWQEIHDNPFERAVPGRGPGTTPVLFIIILYCFGAFLEVQAAQGGGVEGGGLPCGEGQALVGSRRPRLGLMVRYCGSMSRDRGCQSQQWLRMHRRAMAGGVCIKSHVLLPLI